MPGHRKSWFFVKGCEYNPNRSLSLGQVLSDPFQPGLPLLPDGPLPVPEDMVELSHQEGVAQSSASHLTASFRVWADVGALPVIAGLGTSNEASDSLSWQFDRLEGQIFTPRLSYIAHAMQSENVSAQLKRSKFNFRKRLYMVTGVRIARGASLSADKSRAIGANAKSGVNMDPSGSQASLGVDGSFSVASDSSRSFQSASDFVYAYRLVEIYYGKNVFMKPHTRGETYGLARAGEDDETVSDDDDDSENSEEIRILVEGIGESDYDGDGRLHKVLEEPSGPGGEDYYCH
ncbi:hypothetical protein CDD83_3122 [Cordyceps sp. RAO-2017]|nr:hypothetical protein CDD83_3122 [Cordyceps sp. RAO-2017]